MGADAARVAGHPVTPDGRYFVVRGRLWRKSDPKVDDGDRLSLVHLLMDARRAVGAAKRTGDKNSQASARDAVDRDAADAYRQAALAINPNAAEFASQCTGKRRVCR